MDLRLTIYADESLVDVKRVCEADKLKIPYRVAMYLLQSLDEVSLESDEDLLKFVTGNVDKLDKIIKATFGVSDLELDCIDAGELVATLKELFSWVIEKTNIIKVDGDSKNLKAPASL